MSLLHLSPKASALKEKLEEFVNERCIPAEEEYERHVAQFSGADRWTLAAVPPVLSRLKAEAQSLGVWNLFLPHPIPSHLIEGGTNNNDITITPSMYLSNREYGVLCEVMGRSTLAPEACNCSAPDTGNMEVLLKHGTKNQQAIHLKPLLQGKSRSAFLMTEPDVASSDARNLQTKLTKIVDNDGRVKYLLNGKKWWSTGAMDPRCKVALVVAQMDYSHSKCSEEKVPKRDNQTVVVVPIPHPGVKCVRPLTIFGYDDAPHGHAEVWLENVELDESAIVLGEGKGFEISQSRLGPGRIHHCEYPSREPACFHVAYYFVPLTELSTAFSIVGMRAVGLGTTCFSFLFIKIKEIICFLNFCCRNHQ